MRRTEDDVRSFIHQNKFQKAQRECDNEILRGETSEHLKRIQVLLKQLLPNMDDVHLRSLLEGKLGFMCRVSKRNLLCVCGKGEGH